jgi:hypothetical protein
MNIHVYWWLDLSLLGLSAVVDLNNLQRITNSITLSEIPLIKVSVYKYLFFCPSM